MKGEKRKEIERSGVREVRGEKRIYLTRLENLYYPKVRQSLHRLQQVRV